MNQKLYTLEHIPTHVTPETKAIFMLHGVGSNERDLFGLKDHFSEYMIFSLRGPYSRGRGYAWYPVDFSTGVARYDWADVVESRDLIHENIRDISDEYDISPNNTYLMGFSQGAIMSIVYSIEYSDIGGIIALSGRTLRELEGIEPLGDISGLRVFLGHGSGDTVISPDESANTLRYLEKYTKNIWYNIYPIGHTISLDDIDDIRGFLR